MKGLHGVLEEFFLLRLALGKLLFPSLRNSTRSYSSVVVKNTYLYPHFYHHNYPEMNLQNADCFHLLHEDEEGCKLKDKKFLVANNSSIHFKIGFNKNCKLNCTHQTTTESVYLADLTISYLLDNSVTCCSK